MLVSIIIPCFNVEDYIAECIDSVLSQTYQNTEIICIDNNSTDNTYNILERYKENYSDKIILLKETNKGAPAARNKGISIANGEWIQFLDADDLLLNEKIESQIEIVKKNSESGFIAGAYFKEFINGQRKRISVLKDDSFKAIFVTKLGITSANLFKTTNIKHINNWNESLNSSQESDLMFRLLKEGYSVAFDDFPLTVVRERIKGQISQQNPKDKWLQYIKLRIEIINFIRLRQPEYFKREGDYYFNNLFVQIQMLAKYSIKDANDIFNSNFEPEFISGYKLPFSIYKLIFRLIGFKKTERLKRIFDQSK